MVDIKGDWFACGEVLKRTGYYHGVHISVCNECSPESLERMGIFIKSYREKKDKGTKSPDIPAVPPTKEQMKADYELASAGLRRTGNPNNIIDISLEEYLRRRTICIECNGGYRCPYFCCGIQARLIEADWTCQRGKL